MHGCFLKLKAKNWLEIIHAFEIDKNTKQKQKQYPFFLFSFKFLSLTKSFNESLQNCKTSDCNKNGFYIKKNYTSTRNMRI